METERWAVFAPPPPAFAATVLTLRLLLNRQFLIQHLQGFPSGPAGVLVGSPQDTPTDVALDSPVRYFG